MIRWAGYDLLGLPSAGAWCRHLEDATRLSGITNYRQWLVRGTPFRNIALIAFA